MTDVRAESRTCTECSATYDYTEAEQHFRAEHGMNPPVRCPECRAAKRTQRNADLFGNPDRGRPPSGPGQNGPRRSTGRNGRGHNPSDRFPAICAACGASTMVPFMPRGDRPVYCRSCFNARRGR